MRIQAAAAAKRAKTSQPTNPQPHERIPPLPKWIENPKQIPLPLSPKKEVSHPRSSDFPKQKSPRKQPEVSHPSPRPEIIPIEKQDNQKVPAKNENMKVRSSPLQSDVHSIIEDPVKQREQIIRERGRQYALNQWRQQNSVKEAIPPPNSVQKKHESDNSTIVTEVSEQSSFSTGSKSVASRPKAAKLIIAATDDQDSKAEEENQRRLQMFEMVKRKKATEAAEREKVIKTTSSFISYRIDN